MNKEINQMNSIHKTLLLFKSFKKNTIKKKIGHTS
jgi:hypothetical protein